MSSSKPKEDTFMGPTRKKSFVCLFSFCFFCLFGVLFFFVILFLCLLSFNYTHIASSIIWGSIASRRCHELVMRLCQRQEVSTSGPTLVLLLCHLNLISSSRKIILLSKVVHPTSWRKGRKLTYKELYITQLKTQLRSYLSPKTRSSTS